MSILFSRKTSDAEADASPMRPVFGDPGSKAWFDTIAGERMAVLVHGGAVGGKFSIVESVASPGTATPMHTHREEEIFHVLEGVLTIRCDGRTIEAAPGAIVVVPAGAAHGWRNRGGVPVRMVVTFLPGGPEVMLAGLHRIDPAEIAPYVAGFGSRIVGPPIPA